MDSKSNRHIVVSASKKEAAQRCSEYVLNHLTNALSSRQRAMLAISGGSTPKLLFTEMAKAGFDWSKVDIFWVDERCVPPTDSQSNYKLANETLLTPAGVPAENVHRIHGELPPEQAARRYIEEIRQSLALQDGVLPVFDVIHRGIGSDAHTASLFPGEPLIADHHGIAAAVWVEKMKSHRVTLLPGVLIAARATVIQAAGENKAEPIRNVLEGPDDPYQFPCQIGTRGFDNAVWFLDTAAASKL